MKHLSGVSAVQQYHKLQQEFQQKLIITTFMMGGFIAGLLYYIIPNKLESECVAAGVFK